MIKFKNIFGSSGLIPIIIIIASVLVGSITYVTNAEINQHKADPSPHPGTQIKLDMFSTNMKQIQINNKEMREQMNENHLEMICKIHQLKDVFYNIPENKC